MASADLLDVWGWITSLPPITKWTTNSLSLSLFTSNPTQPSMNLTITKSTRPQNPYITFSITLLLHTPIPLWTSKLFHLKSQTNPSLDEQTLTKFFHNIATAVLRYGPFKKPSLRLPSLREDLKDVFNLSFLTLSLLVCVYEAPEEFRQAWLDALRPQVSSQGAREVSRRLFRVLGSNIEEQWMRSLNLAITNWITEHQHASRVPSLLFSYAVSASRLWKVQVYCPLVAMNVDGRPSTAAAAAVGGTDDERLQFSLKYQQLESVVQLVYKVVVKESWIDVVVNVDNIRCDVIALASETLMAERGYGSEEKHFPSRISLQLTPTLQTDVMSVSVSKSTDNPVHEVGREKAFEGSFEPQGHLGLTISASETVTHAMKPWKFEQTVYGNSVIFNWFLHDEINGREVFSSRPSRFALFWPRAWFRDRYSSVYRPFTRQGGVIFAGDEYGDQVVWKVCGGALGKTMEWEIKGWIWLTYWPNKQRNSYSETRRLEFRELLQLPLVKVV